MTSGKRLAVVLVFFLAAPAASLGQFRIGKPIKSKVDEQKPKIVKFQGEVLYVTRVALTVRDQENKNLVRTFVFDEKLAAEIAKDFDRNKPFDFGDRVEIEYFERSDTAVKISGKRGQNRQ